MYSIWKMHLNKAVLEGIIELENWANKGFSSSTSASQGKRWNLFFNKKLSLIIISLIFLSMLHNNDLWPVV